MVCILQQGVLQSLFVPSSAPFLVIAVRRANIIEDTLSQLNQKRSDLKKPLKGKFRLFLVHIFWVALFSSPEMNFSSKKKLTTFDY